MSDNSGTEYQEDLYKKYQPEVHSRFENIEWNISYCYNATDIENPRILLIGDSICNGYQKYVKQKLDSRVNLSYWISSRCVTGKNYFQELDLQLGYLPCQLIIFNNGLHSLLTAQKDWETAFRQAVHFIRAKCPDAILLLANCTPNRNTGRNKIVQKINTLTARIAGTEKIPLIDLYSPMDRLDRMTYWQDDYHFVAKARKIQADIIVKAVVQSLELPDNRGRVKQNGSVTGPDGILS